MDDRIEQRITINASLDRVWDLVTEPGWWVPTEIDQPIDRTPGHVRESAEWGRFVAQVVRVEPQTYAAFRWASQFPGADPEPGNATLVEFHGKPTGDVVEVTLVESGFAGLDAPDDVRAAAWKDNTSGWQLELAELRTRAEAN